MPAPTTTTSVTVPRLRLRPARQAGAGDRRRTETENCAARISGQRHAAVRGIERGDDELTAGGGDPVGGPVGVVDVEVDRPVRRDVAELRGHREPTGEDGSGVDTRVDDVVHVRLLRRG